MSPGAPVSKPKENWKSEPQLSNQNEAPPPPPPRPADVADQSDKRGSCASDLTVSSWGKPSHQIACSLLGPVIVGPSISVDDWVPERPPKKPHLRTVPPPIPQGTPSPVQVPPADQEVESLHAFHKFVPYYDRMPTPELPPPPPPPPPQEEDPSSDEPLPPPPPEIEWHLATAVPRRTSSGPASPQTPVAYSPVKDCLDSDTAERTDNLGSLLVTPGEALKSVYEIQYDQNAINAIMESNRLSKEMQKKKCQSKHRDQDHEKLKSHIETRPPLPLPYDADDKHGEFHWRKHDKSKPETKKSISQVLESVPNGPFVRYYPKSENGSSRASIKYAKNDSPQGRASLRYPSKKPVANGHVVKENRPPEGLQRTSSAAEKPFPPPVVSKTKDATKPFVVKKVSEYESRIPIRDRDNNLSVFEKRIAEEKPLAAKNSSHQPVG